MMEAMIFAAGLGTRLRPLTDNRPKALVEVAGCTLLERCIRKLIGYGCKHIVINTHHFAQMIEEHIHTKHYPAEILLSNEKDMLLDTGGGLKNAESLFSKTQNIIVHNVDIISDVDLLGMERELNESDSIAMLAVSQRKTSRYLLFDNKNELCGWQDKKNNREIISRNVSYTFPFAFSGIQILKPEIFGMIKRTGAFSIIDEYLELSKKEKIKAFIHKADHWFDVGKAEELKEIEKRLTE